MYPYREFVSVRCCRRRSFHVSLAVVLPDTRSERSLHCSSYTQVVLLLPFNLLLPLLQFGDLKLSENYSLCHSSANITIEASASYDAGDVGAFIVLEEPF